MAYERPENVKDIMASGRSEALKKAWLLELLTLIDPTAFNEAFRDNSKYLPELMQAIPEAHQGMKQLIKNYILHGDLAAFNQGYLAIENALPQQIEQLDDAHFVGLFRAIIARNPDQDNTRAPYIGLSKFMSACDDGDRNGPQSPLGLALERAVNVRVGRLESAGLEALLGGAYLNRSGQLDNGKRRYKHLDAVVARMKALEMKPSYPAAAAVVQAAPAQDEEKQAASAEKEKPPVVSAEDKLRELGPNPAYLIQLWQEAKRDYHAGKEQWLANTLPGHRASHIFAFTEKWIEEEKDQPEGEAWGAYQYHAKFIEHAKPQISAMILMGTIPINQQFIQDQYSHYHIRNLPEAISPYLLGLFPQLGPDMPAAQAPQPIPSPKAKFFEEMRQQEAAAQIRAQPEEQKGEETAAASEPAQPPAPVLAAGGPPISEVDQPKRRPSCSVM